MPKSAFTLIELIFVIIIIGILAASIYFSLPDSRLQEAADQVLRHIRYTQHLAMMDDKYTPRPKDSRITHNTLTEKESARHWFNKRWQIVFHQSDNYANYTVFSDIPWVSDTGEYDHNYDGNPTNPNVDISVEHIAIDPLSKKLLTGKNFSSRDVEFIEAIDLRKTYGIAEIDIVYNSSNCDLNGNERIMFDNLGRPYCDIDTTNNISDNPYRYLMNNVAEIKICKQSNCSGTTGRDWLMLCVEEVTGYTYQSDDGNCN